MRVADRASDEDVVFRTVDEGNWDDLVALFERKGGPKHCWCLSLREPWKIRRELDLEGGRAAMERRVREGVPVGLLAYVGGEPVGWCSVAPRETYVPLGGDDYPGERVWSIVCFFVKRQFRKRGLAAGLLGAAVDAAGSQGAHVVEAYPVDEDSPSYRHMGQRGMFAAAGFEETGMVGTRRHVMRLRVGELRA